MLPKCEDKLFFPKIHMCYCCNNPNCLSSSFYTSLAAFPYDERMPACGREVESGVVAQPLLYPSLACRDAGQLLHHLDDGCNIFFDAFGFRYCIYLLCCCCRWHRNSKLGCLAKNQAEIFEHQWQGKVRRILSLRCILQSSLLPG